MLVQLARPTIFSMLDIISEYWQIPVTEQDRDMTTFSCQSETCRFKRMLFRLMNASATFRRTSNILLSGHNRKTCLVYLDGCLIFSKNFVEHMGDIDKVLIIPQRAIASLKLKNCNLLRRLSSILATSTGLVNLLSTTLASRFCRGCNILAPSRTFDPSLFFVTCTAEHPGVP